MSRPNRRTTRKVKQEVGESRVIDKKDSFTRNNDWTLDWFHPTVAQKEIVNSLYQNPLTIVQAPSGCGKSATVLHTALKEYRLGNYSKIILVKNPTEAGDDMLGYLKGDQNEKLQAHMQSMKGIFLQFMSANKLENDMSAGNIQLTIPNYLLGSTLDHAFIIVEEAQTMSPNTLKLIMERAGEGTTVAVVGDRKQTYSIKKRDDGLSDLVNKVCYFNHDIKMVKPNIPVGYVELDSSENQRSELSRFIVDLYDE